MNDTQHKSGIVKILQRFRDSYFLQKSVPLLGGLISRTTKWETFNRTAKQDFNKATLLRTKHENCRNRFSRGSAKRFAR